MEAAEKDNTEVKQEAEVKAEAETDVKTEAKDDSKDEKEINLIEIDKLDKRRLIELDACSNCGECIKWCPVIAIAPELSLSISPPAKIRFFKKLVQSQRGIRYLLFGGRHNFFTRFLDRIFRTMKLTMTRSEFQHFIKDLYACSTCRQCFIVCPAHIDTVELWEGLRKAVMKAGYGPMDNHIGLIASVKNNDNPWQQPRSTRSRWTRMAKRDKKIADEPHMFKPKKN